MCLLNYRRVLLFILMMVMGVADLFAEGLQQVLIVANVNDGVYAQVVKGFKDGLSTGARYQEIFQPTEAALSQEIKQRKPDVIFAVGQESTVLVQQKGVDIPVISTLLQKEKVLQASDSTGVSLKFPFSTQVQWLKKFLPRLHRVAVLYSVAESEKGAQVLKKHIEQEGLQFVGIPVQSTLQLPEALGRLENNADVLLFMPDAVVLSPLSIQDVMLAAFRDRVPLVGLSDNWVKSGALYALTWDYEDLGRQCAAQAKKVLSGQTVKSIPVEAPRKVAYSINTKVAADLELAIPVEMLQKAQTTFE